MKADELRRHWPTLALSASLLLGLWNRNPAQQSSPSAPDKPQTEPKQVNNENGPDAERPGAVSLDEARRRADLLHEAYTGTLSVMHRYYFKDDERTVPSHALKDVFSRVSRRQHVHAKWIAVSARAMSLDNVPETPFQKKAARELRRGRNEHEEIADGEYRRAGAVILFGECIRCHETRARSPVAGLVLRIPLRDDENNP